MKPSEVMPTNGGGGGTALRQAAEEEAYRLDENDAEAEGDEQLILVRPSIEVPDDQPLHHDADQHDEQRAGDHGDDERPGVVVSRPSRHSRRA